MDTIKAFDKLGNELKIGDEVIFMQLNYRNLLIGEIIKITKCTVLIEHEETNTRQTQTRQAHSQVIKKTA